MGHRRIIGLASTGAALAFAAIVYDTGTGTMGDTQPGNVAITVRDRIVRSAAPITVRRPIKTLTAFERTLHHPAPARAISATRSANINPGRASELQTGFDLSGYRLGSTAFGAAQVAGLGRNAVSPGAGLTISDSRFVDRVPEPDTWFLFVTGFAVTGTVLRRRALATAGG